MNTGKTVLAQVLSGLSGEEFGRCARRYPMPRDTTALSAYDHFATMVFAQLTYRESLRDIEACLQSRRSVLYHAGIRAEVKRCNLAYANEHRDAALFAAVAAVLMRRARRLYVAAPAEPELDGELFAIDSTLIDLSLALFPWARWQGTQAAVKLNVMLAVAGEIPHFCTLVAGGRHDVHFLDEIPLIAGSFYVFDRGYVAFRRLYRLHTAGVWFVTRAKRNHGFYVCESRPVCAAIRPSGSSPPRLAAIIRKRSDVFDLSIQSPSSCWFFSPTISPCQRSPSPPSTAVAGKSNCSSSGSNKTSGCADFFRPRPMG